MGAILFENVGEQVGVKPIHCET